jgi:hypothetical protein
MKMRKFADEGFVREGKNENIDEETRARAMASVAGLSKSKPSAGATAVPGRGGPVAAGTLTKPSMITKEQMEKEGFTDLRDYLNFKGGFKRRPDKVNPDMGDTSDKAFLDFVSKRSETPPAAPNAAKAEKVDFRAKSKEQQAKGAKLRGETPGVLGEYAKDPEKRTPKRAGNLTDMLGLSSRYASGGAVSASRRGDGIAQRGKTRGKMC